MSTYYDDALDIIDSEVNGNCKYHVYSQLRDAVDSLWDENQKLRRLIYLYEYGATSVATPTEALDWALRTEALRRELGFGA